MTTKEKILRVMALAVSIEPTSTRYVTLDYGNISNSQNNMTVWVHAKKDSGVIESFEYFAEHEELFGSFDDIIKKLTELKNDMDAERQNNEAKSA